AEKVDDPAERARTREMGETMRQLLENRRTYGAQRSTGLAVVAVLLALAALIVSLWPKLQQWQWRNRYAASAVLPEFSPATAGTSTSSDSTADLRTNLTIAELAKRAPSLRTGNLQAWWAGEQARQVQRLEAQAKRQALAGDHQGAARSASRADAIRSRIPALADFEKPSAR
ncbi:MAG TPA: hypothetical protein VG095_08175, partial [Chthoniobacterales bacterium]|nr:hypothetical protein [Chthoniobacterales bacterium]